MKYTQSCLLSFSIKWPYYGSVSSVS